MQGGEKVQQSGDEAVGWESVAELADKVEAGVIDSESSSVGDHLDGRDRISIPTEQDYAKIREVALNKAVFDDVDVEEIKDYTGNFLDLVDLKELVRLRQKMRENPENSLELAEDFFVDLLGLKQKPVVIFEQLDERCAGECTMGKDEDRIRVNVENLNNPDQILVTLAHENWHSFQHEQMREAMASAEKGDLDYDSRIDLYIYNRLNYIKAEDDIEAYSKQLTEAEAYAFETGFIEKLQVADKLEKDQEFINEHPEIYRNENLPGIRKELEKVLTGMDVKKLLDGAEVENLDEFFEMVNDVEGNAQRWMDGLANLIGLRDGVKVEFVDELEREMRGHLDYKNRRVVLSHKHQQDMFTEVLPKFVWAFKQGDDMKYNPEDERSRLYKENDQHFVSKRHDVVGFEKQLLIRERTEFANTLIQILDEQATEEELMKMPLPKRVASRLLLRKNGRAPVMSKKYHVKRSE